MSYQQGNFTFYAKVSVGYLAPLYQSQCLEFNNSSWGTKAVFSSLSPSRKKCLNISLQRWTVFDIVVAVVKGNISMPWSVLEPWIEANKFTHWYASFLFFWFGLILSLFISLRDDIWSCYKNFLIIVSLSGVQNKLLECFAIISRFLVSCRQQKNT